MLFKSESSSFVFSLPGLLGLHFPNVTARFNKPAPELRVFSSKGESGVGTVERPLSWACP